MRTITVSAPTRRATHEVTALIVPAAAEGARKSWRKLITSADASGDSAYAFHGEWLDAGVAYEVPVGAIMLTCDRIGRDWDVRMLRAAVAELVEVKAWTLRSALGKRVVGYVARRLPRDCGGWTARRIELKPNRWPGWCRSCHNPVPAGEGLITADDGRTRVTHKPSMCLPPPPPREIIEPNTYPGHCFACGGWMEARTGVAILRDHSTESEGRRYAPMHKDSCPADALPGPRNQFADWCADCGELVQPREGYLRRGVHHAMACPSPTVTAPTWTRRRRRNEPALSPGQAFWARFDTYREDQSGVPRDAPGWRILAEGYEELVAVVVETVDRRRARQRVRFRAATPQEAADLLAERVARIPDAQPAPAGFKARVTAERIGPHKPWLAEITGRCPDNGFQRDFLHADEDWTNASWSGRLVQFCWTLTINRVYEHFRPVSWKRSERYFLRATPEGDVVEISREEVEAWLDNAAVWPSV